MGSDSPLKNEIILLGDLWTRLHDVEDIGIAEMSFGLMQGTVTTKKYSTLNFLGKDFQL